MAKILLIDDEEPMRVLISQFLVRGGHEVTTAVNGLDAARLVAENRFDLVITDLVMPEREGIETIIDLRRQQPALPIIAISGGGRVTAADYLRIAQRLGVKATLAKPFSGTELITAVDQVLGTK